MKNAKNQTGDFEIMLDNIKNYEQSSEIFKNLIDELNKDAHKNKWCSSWLFARDDSETESDIDSGAET